MGGIAKARSGVLLGHHYQADSGTAGEAITHSVDCIAGTHPLAIPCAFAHSIGAAASIVLRQGQEREASVTPRTAAPTSSGEGAMKFPGQHPKPCFLLISQT